MHAGLGTNRLPGSGLVRENTLRSLLSAVQNGASFVEFDCQVGCTWMSVRASGILDALMSTTANIGHLIFLCAYLR